MELFCLKICAGVGSPGRKFGFIEGFMHSLEEGRMSSRDLAAEGILLQKMAKTSQCSHVNLASGRKTR